ncbi:MAG: hypothetical protein R3E31_10725 [Chloroflexota bacterium]
MDTLAPPTATAESTTTLIPTNTPLPASTIVVTEPATDLSPMEESILPMPLYFGTDTTISRLETDGTTLSPLVTATDLTHWQLATAGTVLYYQAGEKIMRLDTTSLTTSEIANDAMPLNRFDLSPDDEALVYVNRENKLILTDVSGQNKTVLAEGELPPPEFLSNVANDSTWTPGYSIWELTQQMYNPLWSPTGDQIAFGWGGVSIVPRTGGQTSHIIDNTVTDELKNENQPSSYLGHIVQPRSWSPDGSKLFLQEEILTVDISEYRLLVEDVNSGTQTVLTLPAIDGVPISGGISPGFLDLWSQDSLQLYLWSFGNLLYGSTAFMRYDTQTGGEVTLLTYAGAAPYTLTNAPYETDSGQLYLFVDSRPEFIWPDAPKLYTLYQTTPEFLTTGNVANLVSLRSDVVAFGYEPGNYLWASNGSGILVRQLTYGEQEGESPYWPVTDSEWLWMSLDGTQDLVPLPLPKQALQLAWGSN